MCQFPNRFTLINMQHRTHKFCSEIYDISCSLKPFTVLAVLIEMSDQEKCISMTHIKLALNAFQPAKQRALKIIAYAHARMVCTLLYS